MAGTSLMLSCMATVGLNRSECLSCVNIGASIITNTILGAPYCNYRIICPQTLC